MDKLDLERDSPFSGRIYREREEMQTELSRLRTQLAEAREQCQRLGEIGIKSNLDGLEYANTSSRECAELLARAEQAETALAAAIPVAEGAFMDIPDEADIRQSKRLLYIQVKGLQQANAAANARVGELEALLRMVLQLTDSGGHGAGDNCPTCDVAKRIKQAMGIGQ